MVIINNTILQNILLKIIQVKVMVHVICLITIIQKPVMLIKNGILINIDELYIKFIKLIKSNNKKILYLLIKIALKNVLSNSIE